MATYRPWTKADDKTLTRLHGDGIALHSIAKQMQRGKETISKYAARLGLSWDRTAQTAAATEAHKADARVRRAQLALGLLDDAAKLRDRLWTPCEIYNFGGRDNTYAHERVDEPPYRDKRDIIGSIQVAIATSLRLDEYDSGEAGTIGSLLGSLFDNLQAKHGTGDDA